MGVERVILVRLDQRRVELISCRLARWPEIQYDREEVCSESARTSGVRRYENKGNAYKNAMNHSAAPATDLTMLHLFVGATFGVRRRQIPLRNTSVIENALNARRNVKYKETAKTTAPASANETMTSLMIALRRRCSLPT